jgi:hypothetical protein
MIQKIKNRILILSSLLFFAAPFAVPATVAALTDVINPGLCHGAEDISVSENTSARCTNPETETGGFTATLRKFINIFSVIVGVVAVIMIIVGGFRYITSGGASEKVTGAKNTILYAIIGLIIVALAQIIVRFVLSNTQNAV